MNGLQRKWRSRMAYFSPSRYPRLLTVLGTLLMLMFASSCDILSVLPHPPVPTPTPSLDKLAPPPTDCPASPPLETLTTTVTDPGFGGPVEMIGRAPVWAPSRFLHPGTYALFQPTSADPLPGVKIMWQIGPKTYPKVTVRAHDLKTGEVARWEVFSAQPTVPVLIMDPTGEEHGTDFDWAEYRTFLVVDHAGCYQVDVAWPGGGWYIVLAIGGESSSWGTSRARLDHFFGR